MSGTAGALRSPDRLPCRDLASDPPPINPVIPAAGLSSTVTVGLVDYVARWAGYDTEKCIEKALEDGVIEPEYKSDWRRDHDVYRLTPKGLGQSGKHMMDVFERSASMAKLDYEEDMRKGARAAGAAAAGPGKPPPLAAGELIPPICQFRGNHCGRPLCLAVGGTAEPAMSRACAGPPRAAGPSGAGMPHAAAAYSPAPAGAAAGARACTARQSRPPAYFNGEAGPCMPAVQQGFDIGAAPLEPRRIIRASKTSATAPARWASAQRSGRLSAPATAAATARH